MKLPAAIVLATVIATPAFAIDIVSGSGAVVTNGAGMTVINGDPCDGRMEAACLSREDDRPDGLPQAAAAAGGQDDDRDYPYECKSQSCAE